MRIGLNVTCNQISDIVFDLSRIEDLAPGTLDVLIKIIKKVEIQVEQNEADALVLRRVVTKFYDQKNVLI